jgi:hypothetical protein
MAQEAAHQQAVKVGMGALLRRDVRMLRFDEKGSPAADFSAFVPSAHAGVFWRYAGLLGGCSCALSES